MSYFSPFGVKFYEMKNRRENAFFRLRFLGCLVTCLTSQCISAAPERTSSPSCGEENVSPPGKGQVEWSVLCAPSFI